MTPKEIEEAALEHAHQCFSYNASGDAERHKVHIQNQRDSFLAGAFHMQPKIAELEKELTFRKAEIAVYKEQIAELEGKNKELLTLLEECEPFLTHNDMCAVYDKIENDCSCKLNTILNALWNHLTIQEGENG